MIKPRIAQQNAGFTLIEILLVVTIIGIMLAVIVPRAHRATIDAKYNLIRQSATEIASYALEWAEKGIQSQDSKESTATIQNYLASLAASGFGDGNGDYTGTDNDGEWIAGGSGTGDAESNWNIDQGQVKGVRGRVNTPGGSNEDPPVAVEALMPSSDIPINPFNGVSFFASPNDPETAGNAVTGALACVGIRQASNGFVLFSLCFQGTDSTDGNFNDPTGHAGIFYAGQGGGDSIMALRNGVVIAEER